ncbi:MAG: META domain-containing protein [Actinomycetota bacterium]|nr:META domain-containing protein [Actinomycetota bacterium]
MEERYLDALQAADTITRDGDGLSLTGNDTELIFVAVGPPPTAQLVGTKWHLETLLQPRGLEHPASSAAPAALTLSRDGTFTGSTGCRRLQGEWIENLNEILFTSMEVLGNCPRDLRAQDSHVVGVLGDGFTAEVDDRQLTIINGRGGGGLVYRAP